MSQTTTRLNKAIREEILDNILAATDLQARKADILKRAGDVAKQLVMGAQPENFYEATRHLPPEWFAAGTSLYFYSSDGNPAAILDPSPYKNYHINFDDPVRTALHWGRPSDASIQAAFKHLAEEATALNKDWDTARIEARAFLASCKTVEQILERMPELEPHIPKISRPLPLVAPSNLLSTLSSLGFDRTASKAQAA